MYQTNYCNVTKERLFLKLLFSWSFVFIYAQREQKCLFIHVALYSCYSKSAAYKTSRISPAEGTQTHTLKIMTIGESSIWQLSTQPEDINKGTLERDARFLFITTQSIVTEMSGSRFKNFFPAKKNSRSFLWFCLWWAPSSPPKQMMMKDSDEEG